MRIMAIAAIALMLGACGAPRTPAQSGHVVGQATFSTRTGSARTGFLGVARDDEERARGLMHVSSLPPNSGMAFVYPKPTTTTFWMKDTMIPLSIAFWDADGRIVDILEMTPCKEDSCPPYTSRAPYTTALEMSAGWYERHGVRIGDHVEFTVNTE
jgi:uncharacterized membrane protein (UPF0127 family)